MNPHSSPPARPTAAWISRVASGLLTSTPGLQPLDAVRLAMDASAAGAAVNLAPPASADAVRPAAT